MYVGHIKLIGLVLLMEIYNFYARMLLVKKSSFLNGHLFLWLMNILEIDFFKAFQKYFNFKMKVGFIVTK